MVWDITAKLNSLRSVLLVALGTLLVAAVSSPAAYAAEATTKTGPAFALECEATFQMDDKNMMDAKGWHFIYKVKITSKGSEKVTKTVPVQVYTSVRSLKKLPTTKPFWSTTQKLGKLQQGDVQKFVFRNATVGISPEEMQAYYKPNSVGHVKRMSFTARYIVDGKGTNCAKNNVVDWKTGKVISNRNYIDL